MSNVLIGIIGVILFIGLALAGALILGDDFQSANTASEGAAVISRLQQVQAGIEMYRLKTGNRRIMTQDTSFLVPRFLKTTAINPAKYRNPSVPYWNGIFLNNDIDANNNNESMGQIAGWAMAIVGPSNDARARAVCLGIEESLGRTTIPTSRNPTTPIGCNQPVNNSYYVAYATFGQ